MSCRKPKQGIPTSSRGDSMGKQTQVWEPSSVFSYRFEDTLALPSLWHELVWLSGLLQSLIRDSASIPKEKLCFLLFLPLSNPHAVCPQWKSTALTPKHLLGRYWFFLLSISSPDSNKEVKNQGKYKNQSALLWIHTWDSPSLKWDVFVHIWSHNEILQLLWDELALQSFNPEPVLGANHQIIQTQNLFCCG